MIPFFIEVLLYIFTWEKLFVMNEKEVLEFTGKVVEVLPNAVFRVQLDVGGKRENPIIIIAHISGKMRKHHIRVLAGDEVVVEMTPYDLTKGRIIKRAKVTQTPE